MIRRSPKPGSKLAALKRSGAANGGANVGTSWNVVGTGDFNGDGKSDILWRDTSGNIAMWFMNGLSIGGLAGLGNISTSWTIQGLNSD